METNSKRFSAKHASGTSKDFERRKEWILAAKLTLVAVAIFGTVILLGMWM